ncbi:MFS transporter [Chitinophaga vietnamensis]|uniref:MFS transporter n=1 Tax=Chitinophaga vietnamensis TaxID=2593957 RepID=UPI0011776A2A|nr:MFS transporter [Chitinophaga vietnamensis]
MLLKIARTYRTSFTGLSRESWLLSLVLLVNRCSTMVVPFLSMYLTQSMHRSIADAGLVVTLFGVGAVLGSTASGYFIDRLGFRAVQIATSLIGGLLFIAFGYISNFSVLCGMTLLLAFVAEAFRPANVAAVSAYSTPQNLTRSFSLNRLAMNLGWGLGSSLGGMLAAINYHLLFWVEGGVYIIVSLMIVTLLPDTHLPKKEKVAALPAADTSSPWRNPFLLRFLLLMVLYSSCFILMFRLVPVFWKESLHINESVIGLLLGLNGIIIALFEMVMVKYLETRRSGTYYVIAGLVATGIGYAFLAMPAFAPMVMALGAVLFITIGEMLALPFVNTIVMGNAQEHNRGSYAAAYSLTWSIAQIIGPGGGALVIEKYGYVPLWALLALICMACAGGMRLLLKKEA